MFQLLSIETVHSVYEPTYPEKTITATQIWFEIYFGSLGVEYRNISLGNRRLGGGFLLLTIRNLVILIAQNNTFWPNSTSQQPNTGCPSPIQAIFI